MTVRENENRIERLEELTEKLSNIVIGNGKRGMGEILRSTVKEMQELKQRMNALENAQGITNSELNHFRNAYFRNEGLDPMGNPPEAKTFFVRLWRSFSIKVEDKIAVAVVAAIVIYGPDVLHWIAEILDK